MRDLSLECPDCGGTMESYGMPRCDTCQEKAFEAKATQPPATCPKCGEVALFEHTDGLESVGVCSSCGWESGTTVLVGLR